MKSSRKELLNSISKFSDDASFAEEEVSLASSNITPKPKKKKKEEETFANPESWFESVMNKADIKVYKGSSRSDLFGNEFSKKKKRKKKKNGKLTDFNKEFETETALINNLLVENNRFIDNMQKTYNHITSTKSTYRGITKSTTDLAATITSARSASLNMIKAKVDIKKLAQDLHMKEVKEYGITNTEAATDITNSAALTLKGLIEDRANVIDSNKDAFEIYDADESDDRISELLSESLSDIDISDESNKYLKYEKDNVKIKALVNPNDDQDYEFVAVTDEGKILDDYPLPSNAGSLTINHGVMTARDQYGRKYDVEYK